MKLTDRHGWLTTDIVIGLLGIAVLMLLLTPSLTSGHMDDETSLHHHHQHHHRSQHKSRSQEIQVPSRRRRHQKDHHQQQQQHHHHHGEGFCSNVTTYFKGKEDDIRLKTGNILEILTKEEPASYESICYNEMETVHLKTCCRIEDEPKLKLLSGLELQEMVTSEVKGLKDLVEGIANSYEDHLTNLLKKLKSIITQLLTVDFHLPEKHVTSTVQHLLDHLDLFLRHGNVDLHKIVEHFIDSTFALSYYHILHEHVVETADPDPVHSSCVMSVKNHFPGRSFSLARFRSSLSFIRTLGSMIRSTDDIVRIAANMKVDDSCSRRLAKMNYCPKCHGIINVRPCQSFCMNVYTGCLANYMDLDFQWKDFIQVLTHLAGITKSHETVVKSFPRRIEEALIYYHLEAELMYATVSNHCGGHNDSNWKIKNMADLKDIGKRMNDKNNNTESFDMEFDSNLELHEKQAVHHALQAKHETSIYLAQVENSIRDLENRWPFQNIASKFCGKLSGLTQGQENVYENRVHCWNGTAVGEYSKMSYSNSELDNADIIISTSFDATHIGEILENKSMIIFKKTIGSSLPLIEGQFDSIDSSGDYNEFPSGSGSIWDNDYSGSGHEDGSGEEEFVTSTDPAINPDDFEFTDSTTVPHHHHHHPSSSTPTPSTSPATKTMITTPSGKASSASTSSPNHHLLILTSLFTIFITFMNNSWSTLRRLFQILYRWVNTRWYVIFSSLSNIVQVISASLAKARFIGSVRL